MSYQSANFTTSASTIADVIEWATGSGVNRDTIYELRKIAGRLGLSELDLSAVPADLAHFDAVIAPAPYGAVSNAANIDKARKRANSRLRSCLVKFNGATPPANVDIAATYQELIEKIKAREGFSTRGADIAVGRHISLYTLRRLARVEVSDLDQVEVDRLFKASTAEVRKALTKALKTLKMLSEGAKRWPEIAALLPTAEIDIPRGRDRSARLKWNTLTEEFQTSAEQLFAETLVNSDTLAQDVKRMMSEGVSSEDINKFVAVRTAGRKRISRNNDAARMGYRAALTWLAKAFAETSPLSELTSPEQLFDREIIQRAIDTQIARSNNSLTLKNADKSTTLTSRLVNLKTLARHGLRSATALQDLDTLWVAYGENIVKQREMTDEADAVCSALQTNPRLAARFINAPVELTKLASDASDKARLAGDKRAELDALRLFAVATLYAIQLSRPLRTRNIITLRHRLSHDLVSNLRWIKNAKHAEIRFTANETKNERPITVTVNGVDAKILSDWQTIHRARYVELSGIEDSPYLFPGSATPRFVKNGLSLPKGTIAPSSFAELWAKGDRVIGLGLNPHSCRHAIATLVLAHEPGNYAKAAAILGDTEETVRKHYGKDSGEAAARTVRSALLAEYPTIFKRIGGIRS